MMLPAAVIGAYAGWLYYKKGVNQRELDTHVRELLGRAARWTDPVAKINTLTEALFEDQLFTPEKDPLVCNDLLMAQVYLALADAYTAIQNYDKALEMCRRATHCEHSDVEVKGQIYLHLATIWNRFGQYNEALKCADLGIALHSSSDAALQQQRSSAVAQGAQNRPDPEPSSLQNVLERTLFPRRKSVLQVVKRRFEAMGQIESICPRFFLSAIYRDIAAHRRHRINYPECYHLANGALLWNKYHDYDEAKVDLFAIKYFAAQQLNYETRGMVTDALAFCEASATPSLLKARLYLKLSTLQLRVDNLTRAIEFAKQGLTFNSAHQNQKLKARLFVKCAIAENRAAQYLEAKQSAQNGIESLANSTFDFRLKARLYTQKAHAQNQLHDYQQAQASAAQAIAVAQRGLASFAQGRDIDEDEDLRGLNVAKAARGTLEEIAKHILDTAAINYAVDDKFLVMQMQHAFYELDVANN